MNFFLAIDPPTVTHQEKQVKVGNGKPIFYEPTKLKAARTLLMENLAAHKPDAPLAGPVRLLVTWLFPIKGKHKHGEPKTTKPDTDNLQKLLKDCMTASGFWKDDALVYREVVEKYWSDLPGIYIEVEAEQ